MRLFTLADIFAKSFFNASAPFFEVSIFWEILGVEVNDIVFVKFNFLVLNFSFLLFICVIYFKNVFSSYKCIFIVANINFLPLAFKRPFFTFACLLFFQYYFKQSLSFHIRNFTAWATLCFILRQPCWIKKHKKRENVGGLFKSDRSPLKKILAQTWNCFYL